MADVSQVETSFSFEPRTAPVNPAGANRPQDTGGNTPSPSTETAASGRGDEAVTVELSSEAQRVSSTAAPDQATGETQQPAAPDTSFQTSAPSGIEGSDDAGAQTNQVTSFESERSGNGPRNASEASRTLGQVVDTFA
jgi:hypothetical protein